ncbi:MAG: hypothetical protein ACOCP4_03755 [Candidatus Woesearchaeota archaeon]
MKEYIVPNQYSYEEAMWLSKSGDTIKIISGDYGIIPIKGGVNLNFENNATFTSIFMGLGGKGDITITRAKQQKNIKTWFYFKKLLPFELRFDKPTNKKPPPQFCTPEGCILEFHGNLNIDNKEGLSLTPPQNLENSYQIQRPKAILQIAIPSYLHIDFSVFNKSKDNSENIIKEIKEREKIDFAIFGKVFDQKKKQPDFLPFGDIMYLALWTLNRFLKNYGKVAGADKITREGLSLSQFKDGVNIAVVNAKDTNQYFSYSSNFIESYKGTPVTSEEINEIQEKMVSSPDFTLKEHIEFFLDRLHYHLATISIEHALELSLDNFLNGKNGYRIDKNGFLVDKKNNKVSIWKKCFDNAPVKSIISYSSEQIKYLSELIEARNNIAHSGHCEVDANEATKKRCSIIQPLTEYYIYRNKRPWFWYFEGVLPLLKKLK